MSEFAADKTIIGEGQQVLRQLQQQSQNPIIVKFVAPHCPSCETLAPVLQQLVTEQGSNVHLVTVDITEEPELAMELGVRGVPTVILFKGTEVLSQIPGLKPKKLYFDAIQRAL